MAQFSFRVLPILIGILAGLGIGLLLRPDLLRSGDAPAPEPEVASYADAVNAAAHAVVNIYTSKVVTQRVHPLCELPRFQEMCERFPGQEQRMQSSLGSGVIVRQDGYILTNDHVIADADEILVALADGRETEARVVGTDPETDLAVLQIDLDDLNAIQPVTSRALRVGDVVLAIGNPFGIGQTVSSGIVSALGRYGLTANTPYEDFIQTDAAINPGNSGGALIDTHGQLLGINTLIFSRSGGSQGIGFAIPVDLAMEVLNSILEQGRVVRGWLGVEVQRTDDDQRGLLVTAVSYQGPAHAAGIQAGDRILAIDSDPVGSPRDVGQRVAVLAPGTEVMVTIARNGERQDLPAQVGLRPRP